MSAIRLRAGRRDLGGRVAVGGGGPGVAHRHLRQRGRHAANHAALAIYLTQQYDGLFSGCLKGREDFRASALCSVQRSGTMALACATAWYTASPTYTGLAQAASLLIAGSVKMRVFSRYGRVSWCGPCATGRHDGR